ncbi:hypothetical protein KPB2_5560 [Klebsiella pneumoniae Kb677]|nr:hypothetical protein KPB2_5560 [Klebsiella pneumoniae Kb677]
MPRQGNGLSRYSRTEHRQTFYTPDPSIRPKATFICPGLDEGKPNFANSRIQHRLVTLVKPSRGYQRLVEVQGGPANVLGQVDRIRLDNAFEKLPGDLAMPISITRTVHRTSFEDFMKKILPLA